MWQNFRLTIFHDATDELCEQKRIPLRIVIDAVLVLQNDTAGTTQLNKLHRFFIGKRCKGKEGAKLILFDVT